MKKTIALLAAAALLATGLATGPAAPASAAPTGTLMVGDSTTVRVTPTLAAQHPDWTIDGLTGRPVRALPSRIEAYLDGNPPPKHFIMALGTNNSTDPDWTKARLNAALNKLPAETVVYIMLVVRAGDFQAGKDDRINEYNRFGREVSKERPRTFVINWRSAVLSDPTLNPRTGESSLLEDGTHQTGSPYGEQRPGPGVDTYVRLINAAWNG